MDVKTLIIGLFAALAVTTGCESPEEEAEQSEQVRFDEDAVDNLSDDVQPGSCLEAVAHLKSTCGDEFKPWNRSDMINVVGPWNCLMDVPGYDVDEVLDSVAEACVEGGDPEQCKEYFKNMYSKGGGLTSLPIAVAECGLNPESGLCDMLGDLEEIYGECDGDRPWFLSAEDSCKWCISDAGDCDDSTIAICKASYPN